jgi:transposase
MRFKEYDQNQTFLLPPALEEFFPADHLTRIINEVVNTLDLNILYSRYSDTGCHSYHPQMMLKILFYGYAIGERSSRILANRMASDVAYMYLGAMQRPDFRTINRFRKDNIDLIKDFFVQIVQLCKTLGMMNIGTIAIDGTKLKANASGANTKKKENIEQETKAIDNEIERILKECEDIDEQEDREQGDESIYEIPKHLQDLEKRKEKLKRAHELLKKNNRKDTNLTDEESCTMLHRHFVPEPSYNGQIAVEAESGVIVAADLGNNPSDYWGLKELTEQIKKNISETPEQVLADSGYASYENLQYLKDKNIKGYIPDQMLQSISKGRLKNAEFHRSKFRYDRKKDCYICPMEKTLNYRNAVRLKGVLCRMYKCFSCDTCSRKTECTRGEYRVIVRNPQENLVKEMHERLNGEYGKALYSRRKQIVESIFGDIKHNRKIREFLLRGIKKTHGEFMLMCVGKNLRKIRTWMKECRQKQSYQQGSLIGGFNHGEFGRQIA